MLFCKALLTSITLTQERAVTRIAAALLHTLFTYWAGWAESLAVKCLPGRQPHWTCCVQHQIDAGAGGVAPQEVQQAAAPAVPCPPHPGAGQAPKDGGGHALST